MKHNIFNFRVMEPDQSLPSRPRGLSCMVAKPSKPISGVWVMMVHRYSLNGENRVLRGGSWLNDGRNLRSAHRNSNGPSNRNDDIGFRFVGAQGKWMFPWTRGTTCPLLGIGEQQAAPGMLVGEGGCPPKTYRVAFLEEHAS